MFVLFLLCVFTLSIGSSGPNLVSIYKRDKNLDLTDQFKSNQSAIRAYTLACFILCLTACDKDGSCVTATYVNSTCSLFNKQPYLNAETIVRFGVDLYQKTTESIRFCFSHFFDVYFLVWFELKER